MPKLILIVISIYGSIYHSCRVSDTAHARLAAWEFEKFSAATNSSDEMVKRLTVSNLFWLLGILNISLFVATKKIDLARDLAKTRLNLFSRFTDRQC